MGATYKLRGATNTLGTSLGPRGNLPRYTSEMPDSSETGEAGGKSATGVIRKLKAAVG